MGVRFLGSWTGGVKMWFFVIGVGDVLVCLCEGCCDKRCCGGGLGVRCVFFGILGHLNDSFKC